MGLKILGYELPGQDWSKSTIIANIHNENIIQYLFPTTKISTGGIIFPVIFAFGYLGTASIIIYGIIKFLKKKKFEISLFVMAFLLLITWIQYLITPFSAGPMDGGVQYLTNIQSIRYVLGSIFVTELLIICILWKINTPRIAIFSFIAINAVSRFLILFDAIPRHVDLSLILIPIIILVGLFIFGKYVNKFSLRMSSLLFIAFLIFIFSPQLVEENRIAWLPQWKNISSTVHNLPPSEIFVIQESNNFQISPKIYMIKGDQFQHSIVMGSRDNLYSILNKENEINKSPEYVTMLCRKNYVCEPDLKQLKFELEKYGYKEIANDKESGLYKLEK